MLDVALHYGKQNWWVFPCNGKVPAIPKARGGRGCLDATTNPKRIEELWREYPNANVGVATGRRSGLLVIDVDPRKTKDWLASVNALNLPQTFTVRTASGGFHLYFLMPSNCKISIGVDLLPGIDWRGEGGYVIGPGSIVNGVTYEIVRNCPIVPAPASLLDRIRAHKKPRVIARNESGHMLIPEFGRNEHLMRIAGALRRFGIELNAMYEALRAINADHCEPPLHDEEIRTIAASAVRYAPAELAKGGGR